VHLQHKYNSQIVRRNAQGSCIRILMSISPIPFLAAWHKATIKHFNNSRAFSISWLFPYYLSLFIARSLSDGFILQEFNNSFIKVQTKRKIQINMSRKVQTNDPSKRWNISNTAFLKFWNSLNEIFNTIWYMRNGRKSMKNLEEWH